MHFQQIKPKKFAGKHKTINHTSSYVLGAVHTNTIENAFCLLRRGLYGTYHKVSIKHLPRYLAEFTYRFNRRDVPDLFPQTLARLLNRINMPYRELITS